MNPDEHFNRHHSFIQPVCHTDSPTKQWRPAQYSANIPTVIIIQTIIIDGSFISNAYRYALVQSCRSLQHGRSQIRKKRSKKETNPNPRHLLFTWILLFFFLLLLFLAFNLSRFQSKTSNRSIIICYCDRSQFVFRLSRLQILRLIEYRKKGISVDFVYAVWAPLRWWFITHSDRSILSIFDPLTNFCRCRNTRRKKETNTHKNKNK